MNDLSAELKKLDLDSLLNQLNSYSNVIQQLKDKPFCTIRQFREISGDLEIAEIMFQKIWTELMSRSAQLTPEEMMKMATIMDNNKEGDL